MTAVFWILAALLAAVALAFVLPALLGLRHRAESAAADATNIAVYRDQLKELEADLAAGTLNREQYDEARREIERRMLEDVRVPKTTAHAAKSGREAAIAAAIAVPLVSVLLYLAVGNPKALAPRQDGGGAAHELTAGQIEALVERLAARMRDNPEDAQGWIMLGRSYTVLGRFADAAQAYAHAAARLPRDAQVLADYADALAMAQGKRLVGEPERLIARALALDPDNLKALALAGTVAFEKKDYASAVRHWERMLPLVPGNSEVERSIKASIAEARSLGGGGQPARSAAPGKGVHGVVKLAPQLAAKAAPTDTVFIFARAAEGPRAPLAVLRKQVRDLPAEFALDDTMAMAPGMTLSSFPRVVVGARISKTTNAAPQPGDLQGMSPPVRNDASGVTVVINTETR